MRGVLLVVVVVLLTSCDQSLRTIVCTDGCSRDSHDGRDGTNGRDGSNGVNGSNGQDGYSLVSVTLSIASGCTNGGYTLIVAQDVNRNGVLDVAEDANVQSAELCNGVNGTNGLNGTNGVNGTNGTNGSDAALGPYAPVALIVPCPSVPGSFRETFLKLSNGTVIASFSDDKNGKDTRFAQLVPGGYVTTDGRNCLFTYNQDGSFTW